MTDQKKEQKTTSLHELPAGLLEIAEMPKEQPALLAEAPKQEEKPTLHDNRPRTEKERALDALIARRQSIIEQLKAKNPLVIESRRKISAIIPDVRGKGAGRAGDLFREFERLEFEISTSAYTPKKEKELLKRLRVVKEEVSKHKELDTARKKLDSERSVLNSLVSDIKSLEHELFEVRHACDAAYAAVLSERKSAYESRQHHREEKEHRKFDNPKNRVREEKKHYDDDMAKYMKDDYDDTVSMEEICVFEKKEKKKE